MFCLYSLGPFAQIPTLFRTALIILHTSYDLLQGIAPRSSRLITQVRPVRDDPEHHNKPCRTSTPSEQAKCKQQAAKRIRYATVSQPFCGRSMPNRLTLHRRAGGMLQ